MKKKIDQIDKEYNDFIEYSKVDIPNDIQDIALEKIKLSQKNKFNRIIKWSSGIAAAALITLSINIIHKSHDYNQKYPYSQQLTDSQKKAEFENALKIINESLCDNTPREEVAYEDDNFKIIFTKK
jgi:hypothetical protein